MFKHFEKAEVSKSLYGFLDKYKPANSMIITKYFWGERKVEGSKIESIPIGYI